MADKKNAIKYYFASFIIIITSIFIIGVLYFRRLETGVEQFVSHYGYIIAFFFSFLTDVIMQPIGPDLVIVSGIAVRLNPFLVLLVASLGSILASFFSYWLGKKYGKNGFIKLFGKKRFENFDKRYKKYGKYVLLVASLTPVPYVPLCWASGIFNITARTFIFFGIIPRILRFLVVTLVASNIFHFVF